MNPTKRIFVNTVAQYARSLINICLSLYTVPIILRALGQSDYGVYTLIAGIVAMLSFITNAMVITTQRHISYYIGSGDGDYTRRLFSNSVLLHLAVGLLLCSILLPFRHCIIAGLNIDDCRRSVAAMVFIMSCVMIFISFITAPFKALLIAHENIVFISVIDVMDGVLKLMLTLLLLKIDIDRLLIYSYMMTSVFAFELFVYSLYAIVKYKECSASHFIGDFNIKCIREIGGFAGWTTYGIGAVVCRTQGLNVLLNCFYGTVANAAYGIATHLYSAVSFVATSVTNAMNPQIMQAEGGKDRSKMISLAEQESKLLTILMSLAFIPLIIEMDDLLYLWLSDEIPEYAVMLCRCLLIAFIADQPTYGLHVANQATGDIKRYTLIMFTPKLLFVCLAWLLFANGASIRLVMISFIAVEALLAILRLPYMHRTIGLNIRHFMKNVFMWEMVFIVMLTLTGLSLDRIIHCRWGFVYIGLLTVLFGALFVWFVVLSSNERCTLRNLIGSRKSD